MGHFWDGLQTTQRAYLDGLESLHAATLEERDAAARERDQLATQNASLRSQVDTLGSRVVDLVAQRDQLLARIAELEAPDGPEVVYSTNFATNDGWTLLDQRKNHDDSRAVPRNVTFGPSGLRLLAKREATGSGTSLRQFTSADTSNRQVVVPNYFEARVTGSAPAVRGLRPCILWFRPLNSNDGEIDVMENFGGQAYAKATLHSEYSNRKMIGQTRRWPRGGDAVYEYVIRKTPGRIHITVDGETLLDAGPQTNPDFPWERIFETPERTWYPRISVEVGCGNNPGCNTGSPDATFTEAAMVVSQLEIFSLT